MEIHKSKTKDALGILFCISVLCLILYGTTINILPAAEQKFLWVPVLLLTPAIGCLLVDFFKKAPVYVFNEAGLYASASKSFYSWSNIRRFTIKCKTERFLTLKVLSFSDFNNKALITLVLTGTDCCEEKLNEYLNKKIKNNSSCPLNYLSENRNHH